jgi:signal transduction histidine kinase/CheY-like chemotaxis protein
MPNETVNDVLNKNQDVDYINQYKGYALLDNHLEVILHTPIIGDLLNIALLPHSIQQHNSDFYSIIETLVKKAKTSHVGWSEEQLTYDTHHYDCFVNIEQNTETGLEQTHLFMSYSLSSKYQTPLPVLVESENNIGEMYARIGHEINNPLAIALGNLEFLKKALLINPLCSQNTQHYLHALDSSLERIQSIVSGLRYLSSDTSHEARSEIHIYDLLEITVFLLNEIYTKQGITLHYSADHERKNIFVSGYFSELQQVLMNLISNARDAVLNSPYKDILICTELTASEINIKITDSGTGISVKEQTRIFDDFYTNKKATHGTGLGLRIVKRILEDHKGSISVESKVNEGSSFLITLPITESSDRPVSEKHDTNLNIKQVCVSPNLSNVNAVIIDDEPMLLELVAANLASFGMNVFATDSFKRVLSEIKNGQYQLLITDMCMPDCDGLELIKKVKKISADKVKCILMTGGIVNGVNPKSLDSSQIDGVLDKPFCVNNLLELLNKLDLKLENQDVR